jgi:hypothetical protein
MTGRWGKAGVRRDPVEAAARRSRILAARNAAELHVAAAEKKAYAMWKAGKVIPWPTSPSPLDSRKASKAPTWTIACGARRARGRPSGRPGSPVPAPGSSYSSSWPS